MPSLSRPAAKRLLAGLSSSLEFNTQQLFRSRKPAALYSHSKVVMEAKGDLTSRAEFESLQTLDNGTIPDAIERFSKPASDAVTANKTKEIEDSIWYGYNALIATAAGTSHDKQQQLVDFVEHLRRKSLTNESGEEVKHEGKVVWKDLPTFGWVVRDAWNYDPDRTDASRWINQNAFIARLTALLGPNRACDPLELSLFGLWTIRDGLEEARGSQPQDTALQAASTWLIYATKPLFRLAREEMSFDGKVARGGGPFKDEGWKGFNEDRWRMWKDTLTDFIKDLKDEQTTKLARKALEQMMRTDGTLG